MKNAYFVEMTDTFRGEANYSWVKRFIVYAKSVVGAMGMISRETGFITRKAYDTGDMARYNVSGACICFFINETDSEGVAQGESLRAVTLSKPSKAA